MISHSASGVPPRRARQARMNRRPFISNARGGYHGGGKSEHRNKRARGWCVVRRGAGEFRHKSKPANTWLARGAVAKNKSPLARWAGGKSETAASFLGGQAGGQHPPTCAYIAGFSERRPLMLTSFCDDERM